MSRREEKHAPWTQKEWEGERERENIYSEDRERGGGGRERYEERERTSSGKLGREIGKEREKEPLLGIFS